MTVTSQSKQFLDIRVRLKGQVKEQFLDIKRSEGLANNTEVLRFIIKDYYRRNLASKGKAETSATPRLKPGACDGGSNAKAACAHE